jgi:hypothetical protein
VSHFGFPYGNQIMEGSLGDFNEVVTMSERWGGRVKSTSQLRSFQTTLEFCKLTYLGYRGPKYTWTNCQGGQDFVKERLDRRMVNSRWRSIFPEAEIVVEVMTTSDHAVLVLHQFCFKACWTEERGYQEAFLDAWNKYLGVGDN